MTFDLDAAEPFDLDAVVTERSGGPFSFRWGGQTFELAPILDRDIEDQLRLTKLIDGFGRDSLEPEQLLALLEIIAGKDVLARMREARPLSGPAIVTLIQEWMGRQEESLGKFAESTPSSNGTAQPSRRTSRSGRARRTS